MTTILVQGLRLYEPKWDHMLGKCMDLDNSELKKEYGENPNINCCGTIFTQRPNIINHFKSKKHTKQCLNVKTEEYRIDLPLGITPNEIVIKQLKEIRKLKVNYANKCSECQNHEEKIIDLNKIINDYLETIKKLQGKNNRLLKRANLIIKSPPNLIDLMN